LLAADFLGGGAAFRAIASAGRGAGGRVRRQPRGLAIRKVEVQVEALDQVLPRLAGLVHLDLEVADLGVELVDLDAVGDLAALADRDGALGGNAVQPRADAVDAQAGVAGARDRGNSQAIENLLGAAAGQRGLAKSLALAAELGKARIAVHRPAADLVD